jgi:hypothetical protein
MDRATGDSLGTEPSLPRDPSPKDPCACIGIGCCAGSFVAAVRYVETVPSISLITVDAVGFPPVERPSSRRSHVLPFANGPPRARA